MKKIVQYLFIIILVFLTTNLFGQSDNSQDNVIKLDPRTSQFNFVPGVALVRLKDDVNTFMGKTSAGTASMGVASVDVILQKYQVISSNKLFPDAKRLTSVQMLKTYSGKTFQRPSLHNIYKLTLKDSTKTLDLINELKNNSNVVYAEPDYIFSVVDDKPESPAMTEKEAEKWISDHKPQSANNRRPSNVQTVTPNDPLYSQQWGIPATQVNAVWDSTTGDTSQIIAILDTGVDWKHPDLKDNIWLNPNPRTTPDADGVVNDIRGWDYINNDNDPSDDNSHGTHVAGIAAAEGNNGIGIAGVDWHAKIMPIKVFQSDGRGDVATITKGIIYASTHGATVINMSFGSYAESLTMEDALENAYATSVLVAAAGNDGSDINQIPPGPFYPAALSYVLGVQATSASGGLASFSNTDLDGPVYSIYPNLLNYEMRAPGEGIISTIPNGNYRIYSGTSMATPIVSGSVALYNQLYPGQSQELMWGNLINTTKDNLQLFDALNVKVKPELWFVSNTIVDTLAGDNNNGLVDAGETIQLWFMVRNTWGQSDSVFVGLKFGEFEDTTTAQILKDTAFIGSISPYARRSNERNPLLIHISPNVAHDRDIVFEAYLWYAGSIDTVKQKIILTVNHGTYLAGVMDSTMTLTPDKLWLVSLPFRIGSSGVLVIQPGTQIINNTGINNKGKLFAYGSKDSNIVFTGNAGFSGTGNFNFQYTSFNNINSPQGLFGLPLEYPAVGTYNFNFCQFIGINTAWFIFNSNKITLTESILKNCYTSQGGIFFYSYGGTSIKKCNFSSSIVDAYIPVLYSPDLNNFTQFIYNNLSGLKSVNDGVIMNGNQVDCFMALSGSTNQSQSYNNFIGFSPGNWAFTTRGTNDIIGISNQYWGSNDSILILKNAMLDFWKDATRPMANYYPYLSMPNDSAHGIVWKVLVDGIDPQDQANLMNPIGVGPHRFDVYFNRPMDTTYKPMLTFGVRLPFNQQAVADSGHWSDSARIWTAYKTVKLYTGDGINTIRVANAQDPEGFQIPVEDMRFSFLISAASSSSVDFTATAGLGKVNLEWTNPQQVPDLLGYNIYRFQNITDTTFTSPVMVNSKLVTDTVFTDFNVIPNIKYYYYYKTVNTDFSQSDSSRIASTTPYTASLGDANGDLTVNIMDVLSIVSYMLGQNPQPFIFAAADVNQDNVINILDVIGDVNIILHGTPAKQLAKTTSGNAALDLSGNNLSITSDMQVGGIEFILKGKGLKDLQFTPGNNLASFEVASAASGDTSRVFLIYSMKGESFPKGNFVLGSFSGLDKSVQIASVIISDPLGHGLITNIYNNGVPMIPKDYYINQNFPNPFNPTTTIQYGVPELAKARIVIYNILGQQIKTFDLGQVKPGRYQLVWDGRNNSGLVVASGVYIYRFESMKYLKAMKMLFLK